MPIRSQIDTSMYRGMGSGGTTIGDILNAVNTVSSLTGTVKERKRQNKEDEDLKFINGTIGKYMQGYNGQDPNDLYQRKQGAYNEIMTARPELSKYVSPMQDKDTTGLQNYQKNELGMQNDRLALDTAKTDLERKQADNKSEAWKRKIERSLEAAQKLSEVQDDFGYGKVLQDYGDVLGEIDPYYQNYATSQNPATAFWRGKAGELKQKKLIKETREIEDRDLKVQGDEADIKYKNAQIRNVDSEIKKRQWGMDNPKEGNLFRGLGGSYVNSNDIQGTLINGLQTIPNTLISKGSVDKAKAAFDTYLDLTRQIDNLEAKYAAYGTELVGNKAEIMKANVRGIQLTLKELENLGVLNGPDLMLMEQMVPNPVGIGATVRGAMNPVLGEKYSGMLNSLKQRIGNKLDANLQTHGFKKDTPSAPVAQQSGPKPGDMDQGYVFKGGDPADPKNWELVK